MYIMKIRTFQVTLCWGVSVHELDFFSFSCKVLLNLNSPPSYCTPDQTSLIHGHFIGSSTYSVSSNPSDSFIIFIYRCGSRTAALSGRRLLDLNLRKHKSNLLTTNLSWMGTSTSRLTPITMMTGFKGYWSVTEVLTEVHHNC